MGGMIRAFVLDGFAADDARVLRIGSARNGLVHPVGFRLTKGEARTLATLLLGWLCDYPHGPGGCEHGSDCPCRIRAAQEVRGTTA